MSFFYLRSLYNSLILFRLEFLMMLLVLHSALHSSASPLFFSASDLELGAAYHNLSPSTVTYHSSKKRK